MTSAHAYNDTRIFLKECRALYEAGFDVSLIVQHDKDEVIDGVQILGLSKPKNRRERMLQTTRQVYKRALECDADIYHFHDPELIPVGLRLKRKGKKVIYDVHEDVPRQILSKQWIPVPVRKTISWTVERIENYAAKRFDGIVTATNYIADIFKLYNNNVFSVQNYPISEGPILNQEKRILKNQICYVSSHLSVERGIVPIIEAMKNIEARLILAGQMDQGVYELITGLEGWEKTEYIGFVDQEEVQKIMSESKAGLVIFSLEPNYVNALPTKMFEYMRAGIPVVVNDIPILREIIDKYNCGICVTPMSVTEIADAVNWIILNSEKAAEMGERGQYAVEVEYNWAAEVNKLLGFYNNITFC